MRLASVRYHLGKVAGRMEALGFPMKKEATFQTLSLDVIKSSEIEGEVLQPDQVRSSMARHLGIKLARMVPSEREVDGVVAMMVDAAQNYAAPLTARRLFGWHAGLFPTGKSGGHKIVVGGWRNNPKEDPMQVVSGALGKQRIHFEAPSSDLLNKEMKTFLQWFNNKMDMDPVLKAGIAHLWFVTIHPFDDGNGRIARAIADLQLARADQSKERYYSMSAQIQKERKDYYRILEESQKGTLDISAWLNWFFNCLDRSLTATETTLAQVMKKARFWETVNVTALNERQRLVVGKLLEFFEGKLTSSKWAAITKCSQDTALRDIQDLIDRGILLKDPAGGRSSNYLLK